MTGVLRSMAVAFLAAEGTERSELIGPWEMVAAEDGRPVLVAPGTGKVELSEGPDADGEMPVDVELASADVADFAALVLPGGAAGPDRLRSDAAAVDFVRSFCDVGKPVAAICRAPWAIVEANRIRGRTVTSWPGLQTDVENAGGTWTDEEVVTCTRGRNVLVTSRGAADLPPFCDEMLNVFAVLGRR
jgi:protease I